MTGKSPLTATAEQRDGLERLARSADREEADRARGHSVVACGLEERGDRGGLAGARGYGAQLALAVHAGRTGGGGAPSRPGAGAGEGASGAGGGARGAGGAGGEPGELHPAAAGGGDRTAHRADDLALAAVGGVAQKGGFASKRPRHTLRGRQDRQAVARSGLGQARIGGRPGRGSAEHGVRA